MRLRQLTEDRDFKARIMNNWWVAYGSAFHEEDNATFYPKSKDTVSGDIYLSFIQLGGPIFIAASTITKINFITNPITGEMSNLHILKGKYQNFNWFKGEVHTFSGVSSTIISWDGVDKINAKEISFTADTDKNHPYPDKNWKLAFKLKSKCKIRIKGDSDHPSLNEVANAFNKSKTLLEFQSVLIDNDLESYF
jgi:hypothetical protein